jgi:putative endonuclease
LNLSNQDLGKWGEELATNYLVSQGYALLASNVRTPYGEIDLIVEGASTHAEQEKVLVFVEVKTRRSRSFGPPEESITPKKQEHLVSSALHYLQEHPDIHLDWRVDVIAIQRFAGRSPKIQHFENAIQE